VLALGPASDKRVLKRDDDEYAPRAPKWEAQLGKSSMPHGTRNLIGVGPPESRPDHTRKEEMFSALPSVALSGCPPIDQSHPQMGSNPGAVAFASIEPKGMLAELVQL
jgi:hypothetical protein